MSWNAKRHIARERKRCACGNSLALHYSPSHRRYRWSPDHPLCLFCWQSVQDAKRDGRRRRAFAVQRANAA
jgi:hypothetical protein